MSQYPGVSHTFFMNELLELRRQGVDIRTASINDFGKQRAQTQVEAAESARTFYPKAIPKPTVILTLLRILFTSPAIFFRGLKAALGPAAITPSSLLYALFYFVEALLVGDWMQREKLTHLHVHFAGAVATVGRITGIAYGIPYSITIHGPEEFYNETIYQLATKIRDAKFVICISFFCRSQIMRRLAGDRWKKLVVSRLGIDLALFPPRQHANTAHPVSVVCTGRLIIGKGQRVLAQACAALIRRNIPVRLTIIGDGPDREGLTAYVQQLGITDHVLFTGATNAEQTRQHLSTADIFSLPSFAEGIPVSLMEAMACQVPCISTFVAGIPELITDGVDGILVPPSSVQHLEAALERLALSAQLRQTLGEAARDRIHREYNLQSNATILADIFRTNGAL